MEILDQRTVAVEFPTGKLFGQTIEKVKSGNDFTLEVVKLKIKVQVKMNLRVTNLCSC